MVQQNLGTHFLKRGHFSILGDLTSNFRGQYLNTRSFLGKTLLLNAECLTLVCLPWKFQLDSAQNVKHFDKSISPLTAKILNNQFLGYLARASQHPNYYSMHSSTSFFKYAAKVRVSCAYTLTTTR